MWPHPKLNPNLVNNNNNNVNDELYTFFGGGGGFLAKTKESLLTCQYTCIYCVEFVSRDFQRTNNHTECLLDLKGSLLPGQIIQTSYCTIKVYR